VVPLSGESRSRCLDCRTAMERRHEPKGSKPSVWADGSWRRPGAFFYLEGTFPVRWLSVLIGGAIGTLARWGINPALPTSVAAFPWATLTENITSAFGLGLVGVMLTERLAPTRYLRTLIGIGFFGAYTTFSTMAVEGVRLIDHGRADTAFGYWILTLVLGQAAGVYGMFLGRVGAAPTGGQR